MINKLLLCCKVFDVHLDVLTYFFKCLDAMLAAMRDVHTLCLNIKSAFLTTAAENV